jgi:hypothetical protein
MQGDRSGRWARWIVGILAGLVFLAVVIRLVLDPIAAHYTRQALAESKDVRGDFSGVHVTVLPPGYEIRKLKLVTRRDPDWRLPLFYAARVRVVLNLGRLLHRQLVAWVRVDRAKVTVNAPPHQVKNEVAQKAPELPDLSAELQRVVPVRVDRIVVRKSEVVYRDPSSAEKREVWLHDIDGAVENVSTRRSLARGRPTTLSASATVGRSGHLTLFVSADPFARQLDFTGNLAVRGLRVAELYGFIEPATELQTPEGTLDVYAEWKARDGAISGGVKPVLKGVTIKPAKGGLGNRLKAWFADKGLHIFSNRASGRSEAATVVPIEGRLDRPDLQLWPTVFGVVRNAFVEGVTSGFSNLPPGMAPKHEGPLEQGRHAVQKSAGPPKAQPVGGGSSESGSRR